jgi:hypothetical protein
MNSPAIPPERVCNFESEVPEPHPSRYTIKWIEDMAPKSLPLIAVAKRAVRHSALTVHPSPENMFEVASNAYDDAKLSLDIQGELSE